VNQSPGPNTTDHRIENFERSYYLHVRDIAAYVARRVPKDEVDDVVAKVFGVAWRRFDVVPSPPEDRLWLFGVARRCVGDHVRSSLRQRRLHLRLSQEESVSAPTSTASDPRYELVMAAMGRLKPLDREALQLVLWDDLSHAEAAFVMGCSVNAFELRYRRARNNVRATVEGPMSTLATSPVSINPNPLSPEGATS
jgi:RNA polymerase sigma factor (sigma-70 family)